jgi:DNA-binding transcriptional ArsR family regulator
MLVHLKKQVAVLLVIFSFACVETGLALDYVLFMETGSSLVNSAWGPTQAQNSVSNLSTAAQAIFWRNSFPLAATSWAVFCITFFRRGISRKWRSLGFDRDVFGLMVTMKGARSRLTLLKYLSEPRHKSELSTLAGLDWKEVDRELNLLERFGLISLHVQSGSVKLYKLSEHGKLLLKLIAELTEVSPNTVTSRLSLDSER